MKYHDLVGTRIVMIKFLKINNIIKFRQMKKYVSLMCIVFILSCNKNVGLIENTYSEEIDLTIEEINIKIDSNVSGIYNLLSAQRSSKGTIIGYNYFLHTLDVIDIINDSVFQIPLNKDGENSIPIDPEGLFLSSMDSIWIYHNHVVYLIDRKGVVKQKHFIPFSEGKIPHVSTNYAISTAKFYFNENRKSFFYLLRINDNFFVHEYFPENGDVIEYELEYTLVTTQKPLVNYGWKQLPNVCFTENNIVYNYPFESNVYQIDLLTKEKKAFGGKSRYTDNKATELKRRISYENAERHKMENIHFCEVMYNEKFNIYYRLHFDKIPFKTNDDPVALYNQKKIFLTIFDNDFSIIKETELESNVYNYATGWVMTNNGLAIFHSELQNPNTDNELLKIDIIRPK